MKKIAIFVEGQTEMVFVRRLLEEIGGSRNIHFQEERWHAKTFVSLTSGLVQNQRLSCLIVDCCSDGNVVSAILDRHQKLSEAGYEIVLGLRDLYPTPRSQLATLIANITAVLPRTGSPVRITIALSEVESWFLQEDTHFGRIDPALTRSVIHAGIGYDIVLDRAEDQLKPSATLRGSYQLAGKTYSKRLKHVSRTVAAIDYANLYLAKRPVLSSFDHFVQALDDFLVP